MINANNARPVAEPGHAEHPAIATDPVWSDTWAFAAVDPDSKQAAFMHILCNSSTGKTRHMLMGISDGKGWREDAYTDNYLQSELVDVELDNWQRYSIRHRKRDIQLDATSDHEPFDFKKLLTFKDFSLGHLELGCHVTGNLEGKSFNGVGLRDRSFGPRPMGGVGLLTTVIMCSMDARITMSINVVHGAHTPPANDADTRFGFLNTPDNHYLAKPEEIGIRRQSDGLVHSLRLADDVVTLGEEIGNHVYTPHWYPSLDLQPSERKIFTHVLRFYEGYSGRYGRMAGLVDQAMLASC